eukprot:TRINITY_DN2378_c0_g1_i1.p1 TRINITY_DN2378_c0_g1~~TRINITY_DN2378_c0_g1_i1.p1  ORF type:complete len:1194 (+),score=588.43 TRINITY_DN2378_c0_g1_i1:100-3681(+)
MWNDVKKCLNAKSDRVKAVDLHPREPWVICSLYSGKVTLHNYDTQDLLKSFDVGDMPVRSVKFVARMNWFVCTSDDRMCRVYNYNTMEKVREFETHQDYIRGVAVHDSQPYIVTCSDDMTAKLWNWEKQYQNTMMFEGHNHYVMAVTFNPKDPNTFATASLDRSIKVWDVNSWHCNFTLEGHSAGVNAVDYYPGGDKPYLVSGSDDHTVKVWDYQTRACVQTLSHHQNNVSCCVFFTEKPIIITGSEDETAKFWALQTYRLEVGVDYQIGRVWGLASRPGVNKVAIAGDQGTVVISIGKEEPVCSMDGNGKVIFAVNNDITQVTIKGNVDEDALDGDKLSLPVKDMGNVDEPPKRLLHNANGQYVAVLHNSEYSVNSALAWRPKSFGPAKDFAWSSDPNVFGVLTAENQVQVYRNGKVSHQLPALEDAERIFGGALLGVYGAGWLSFYQWDSQVCIRQISVHATSVHWNPSGQLVALIAPKSFFVLRYNPEAVVEAQAAGSTEPVEEAFDLLDEIEDKPRRGTWTGDCFLFSNHTQHLNYYMGGEVHNIAVLERPMWLLGYVPKDNRIYLTDKDRSIVSYVLYQSVIEYQTLVLYGQVAEANAKHLPKIKESMRTKVAKFLDQQGYKAQALEVSTENDHRFQLAMELHRLDLAREIAALGEGLPTETMARWRRVGGLALQHGDFECADEALTKAKDYPGLLMLHSSLDNRAKLAELQAVTTEQRIFNVAFQCAHLVGDMESCVNLLCESERPAEACFFARSYCPTAIPRALVAWKKSLGTSRLAEALAEPQEYPNLFPELDGVFAKPKEAVAEEAVAEAVAEEAVSPEAKQPGAEGFVQAEKARIDKAEGHVSPPRAEKNLVDPDDDPFSFDDDDEAASKEAEEAARKHAEAAAADARRKAEEEARKAAEAKRQAEEEAARKAAEEAAQQKAAAEAARKAAEEQARREAEAAAARKAAEEAKRKEEQKRAEEEAARKVAELEAQRRAEAARKAAEEEARKAAEAARKAAEEEAARKAAEAARKAAEEEAARKAAEEQKRAEEEAARKAAEAARKAAEEEAARKAAEEQKRAEEEAARKAAELEAQRQAEAARKAAEEAAAAEAAKKAAEEAARREAEEAAAAAAAKATEDDDDDGWNDDFDTPESAPAAAPRRGSAASSLDDFLGDDAAPPAPGGAQGTGKKPKKGRKKGKAD